MSKWTHNLCNACWQEERGSAEPIRLTDADVETCCKCTELHQSGIYLRADPDYFPCEGIHVADLANEVRA